MTISNDHVVEIDYKLTDEKGAVLDSSEGHAPLAYLHGKKNIIPGLEKQLEGRKTGDQFNVTVAPEEAYGLRHQELINKVPLEELAGVDGLAIGVQLQANTPKGVQIFTVVDMNDQDVTLDGNHPLAGMTLSFAIKVISVRKATAEELAHGHAHGPHGHHH